MTRPNATRDPQAIQSRLDWVDVAKGVCIVLVVLMHATLGVEKAVGSETSLHAFIDWARPFRMPDFFLISGLFLAARIDRPWRSYLDTKVVHFAYFYVLWLTIQREERRNAMSHGVLAGLGEAIRGAQADRTLRAIVITGAGSKAFCAGADLSLGAQTFDYDS